MNTKVAMIPKDTDKIFQADINKALNKLQLAEVEVESMAVPDFEINTKIRTTELMSEIKAILEQYVD